MQSSAEQAQQSPAMCVAECGFYGSPAFQGHCSKCFKAKNSTNRGGQDASSALALGPTDNPRGSSMTGSNERPTDVAPSPTRHNANTVANASSSRSAAVALASAVAVAGSATTAASSQEPTGVSATTTTQPCSHNMNSVVDDNTNTGSPAAGLAESSTGQAPFHAEALASVCAAAAAAGGDTAKSSPRAGTASHHTRPVKKRRCHFPSCRTKLSLTDIECRCGMRFCSLHRYPEKHSCTFDYKSLGRQELDKAKVVCAGDHGVKEL